MFFWHRKKNRIEINLQKKNLTIIHWLKKFFLSSSLLFPFPFFLFLFFLIFFFSFIWRAGHIFFLLILCNPNWQKSQTFHNSARNFEQENKLFEISTQRKNNSRKHDHHSLSSPSPSLSLQHPSPNSHHRRTILTLQKVEQSAQPLVGSPVKRLANQERQLVSVLDRSRDADRARPVVVQMTKHIGYGLELPHVQIHPCVHADIKVHGVDRALTDALRDEEEVVPVRIRHAAVDDGARTGVGVLALFGTWSKKGSFLGPSFFPCDTDNHDIGNYSSKFEEIWLFIWC